MATKKAASKKTAAKKSGSGRKYSPEAGKSVEREMKAMKEGKLKSGGSGKKCCGGCRRAGCWSGAARIRR